MKYLHDNKIKLGNLLRHGGYADRHTAERAGRALVNFQLLRKAGCTVLRCKVQVSKCQLQLRGTGTLELPWVLITLCWPPLVE